MKNFHNDLAGKVVLVTGASSGLGEHFAKLFAEQGANVALAARSQNKLDEVVASIKGEGGQASRFVVDVASDESVKNAIRAIQSTLGTIDILINNAGIADSKRFLSSDEDSWQKTLDTNLTGVWRVALRVSQSMVAAGQAGCILNIASILGLRVGFGNSAYATSKAGVIQLTKAMALELTRKGIRVNALCPGYFETAINAEFFATEKGQSFLKNTPAGRAGKLEELDGAVLLLCSSAGSFINGAVLPVDGGHLVSSL